MVSTLNKSEALGDHKIKGFDSFIPILPHWTGNRQVAPRDLRMLAKTRSTTTPITSKTPHTTSKSKSNTNTDLTRVDLAVGAGCFVRFGDSDRKFASTLCNRIARKDDK